MKQIYKKLLYLVLMLLFALIANVASSREVMLEDWVPPPGWLLRAGVSYFQFDPNLPRDLTIHQTHPDDQSFLFGSAGETKLNEVDSIFLDFSAERTWSISDKWSWSLCYLLKIPMDEEGREGVQNENDFRPSTEGSFIYSQVNNIDPAHEFGVNFSYRWFSENEINFEFRPGFFLGYWKMDFEKGWDRFGVDETSLSSGADGFSFSPKIAFAVGTPDIKLDISGGYRVINLEYDTDIFGSSEADGWEIGLGVVYRF
ncbi:hypothetical protein VU04_05180 [Desulfobulbus sp. TB]|nr:hypothetical protein [Desulfobulbus sp. TB]